MQNLLAALLAEWGLTTKPSASSPANSESNKLTAAAGNAAAASVANLPLPATAPGAHPTASDHVAARLPVSQIPAPGSTVPTQTASEAGIQLLLHASGEGKLAVSGGAAAGTVTADEKGIKLVASEPSLTQAALQQSTKFSAALDLAAQSKGSIAGQELATRFEALQNTHSLASVSPAASVAINQQIALGSAQAVSGSAGGEFDDRGSKKQKPDMGSGALAGTDRPASWLAGETTASGRPAAAPADQVANEIVAHAQQLGPQGRTDFHFQLEPPDLGPVRVHLSAADGQVSARLVVREDGTRQLLQSQMDTLMQRLSQAGIALGRFDVSQDGAGFQERWQNPRPETVTVRVASAATAPGRPAAAALPAAGLIDVVA